MTLKSIFKLAMQLLGLYLLVFKFILLIPSYYAEIVLLSRQFPYATSQGILIYSIVPIITLLIGLLLIFTPEKLSKFFIREDSGERIQVSKRDLIEVVVVIAGIMTIVSSLHDVRGLALFTYSMITPLLVKFVLGFVIVWKACTISGFIENINAVKKDV